MILKKIKKRALGWRPLVLHWRRRRVLRPAYQSTRVSAPVSISYFPQVHLHFTTHVTKQNHRSVVQRIFSATTVQRERVLLERRLEKRIYADKKSRSPREQRSLPLIYKTERSTPRLSIQTTRLRTVSGPSAPIRQIQQPPASVALKSVSHLTLRTRRAEQIHLLTTQRHTRELRSELLSFRSASHETLLNTNRIEELVWRRTPKQTTSTDNSPIAHVTQTTRQQPARHAIADTQVVTASAEHNQTTPQQLTKFDPGVLDRLTDDIIRRVEKRARIERQRRGL